MFGFSRFYLDSRRTYVSFVDRVDRLIIEDPAGPIKDDDSFGSNPDVNTSTPCYLLTVKFL